MKDSDIVKRVVSGDIESFGILVKRYEKRITNLLHKYSNSPEVEDVIQDTFVEVYKNIRKVKNAETIYPYLAKIAKNKLISLTRKRKFLPLKEDIFMEEDEEIVQRIILSEDISKLAKYIKGIKEIYKKVISLYYYSNLSYKEISIKLGIPVNTVRTNLKRGKEVLRKEMENE